MPEEFDEYLFITRMKGGDFGAFEYLFSRYYQPLCNYAVRFVSDIYIAEDVVQDVFEKLWNNRKQLNIKNRINAYLYTAVKNRCLNKIKSNSLRTDYLKMTNREEDLLVNPSEIESEEFRRYLFDCIEKLPPRCKEIFKESRFENEKQEKIAEKNHISIKTVKAQIGKALKYVRECLETAYPEFIWKNTKSE